MFTLEKLKKEKVTKQKRRLTTRKAALQMLKCVRNLRKQLFSREIESAMSAKIPY